MTAQSNQTNTLYPIFLKLDKVGMLIVGAGKVGLEKLHFILKNSPDAIITILAENVSDEVFNLVAEHKSKRIEIIEKMFESDDVCGFAIVIAATNDIDVNKEIYQATKLAGSLVNVADTPGLCDFYLGSIVTKGPLKVAISTNGQSPTFAKRFRQILEELLPNDTELLIENLNTFRNYLKNDFAEKVSKLNAHTKSLVEFKQPQEKSNE